MKKLNNLRKTLFVLILLCTIGFAEHITAQDFTHPGIFNRESDFARMRQKVAEKAEPWYSAWNNLLSTAEAQLTWNPRATETVIRGGTGDNISLMYRDVAAAYEHALIYKISGDKKHGDKAIQILNAWSLINKAVSGNADRYLAAGLNGYQFANAAELMRGYPGFEFERFKEYMLNVFYYPMNERFILGNDWGSAHNDACSTNYRVNWDICNMNAMLAISILCDNKDNFNKTLNYAKYGDGTGNINRAVNFVHSDIWGQWEESGRDQGHAVGGLTLYGIFCEIAWNQGVDFYGYSDSRYRKGAEYVARYNIMNADSGKYNDLPYTSYSRLMGSNCSWYTESTLGASVRGKYGSGWEMIYNHYANRMKQGDKVKSIYEILQQQPSSLVPSIAIHADTYDTPGVGTLTFKADSGSYILPWLNMDVMPMTIELQPNYGSTTLADSILTVKGSGTGIKGTTDNFQFVYQRMIDDGSIITRFNSLDEVNSLCQAGIMIRENLEQNSSNLFLSLSASGLNFTSRDSLGTTTKTIKSSNTNYSYPYWLKLTKSNNVITASTSTDGINWDEFSIKTINMNRDFYIGLAVSANNTSEVCTAVFEKTKIVQGNIKPVAKITAPVKNLDSYIAPANITIKGLAYDLDALLDKTELYINDSLVLTSKVSPFSYSLKSLEAGTYSVYIKAYDRAGATQTSDTSLLTVNPKTTKLPWYKFDETKTGFFSVDASGNSLTALLYNGTQFSAGKINNSVSLDGVDDYVKLPTSFIHKLSDFSISTWVKINSLAQWSRIFDFGQGTEAYMMLTPYDGTGIRFEIKSPAGSQSISTTSAFPVGSWTFVTITLTNNTISLYLNGILKAKLLNYTLRPYDIGASTYSYLGKSQYSTDSYLNGQIDEFRFFNYALSTVEINDMMSLTAVEKVKMNDILCYPNPAKDEIHVLKAENSVLKFYDTTGRIIMNQPVTSANQTINISNLKSGYYIINIESDSELISINKLIVQ